MDSGQHARVQSPGILRRFFDLLGWMALTCLLTWLMLAYVGQAYGVPSGSMERTIMMGDNCTNSQDSRSFGAIPVSSVDARCLLVLWPPDDVGFLK